MSLNIKKKKNTNIPPIEGGTYPAVCVAVVDLGEQYSEYYKKYSDKVMLIWSLPGQTVEIDGESKPRWLSKEFTASLSEKSNLSKFLVSWRGRPFTQDELDGGFQLQQMLGNGCLLQVLLEEKDDRKWNSVNGAIAFPAGMPCPTTAEEKICFDMDTWDDYELQKLPQWVQDRVQKSTQWQKQHAPETVVDVQQEPEKTETEECPI